MNLKATSIHEISVASPPPVTGERSTLYFNQSIVLLALGSLIQVVAYGNIQPVLIGMIFFFAGLGVLRLPALGGLFERRAFQLIFAVCFFWAGVAAIYRIYFNDYGQNYLDAWSFYRLASGYASGSLIDDLRQMTEGSGAVLLWRFFYDFFAVLGFEKGPFVGISVNTCMVAMTAVIGVKIVKTVFGSDAPRLKRFILLFSFCGLFWEFAAIHLRDASILFAISVLVLFWTRFTSIPNTFNFLWLVIATLSGFVIFGFLRREFFFVPLAMMAAGLAAMALDSSTKRKHQVLIYVLFGLFSAVFAYLLIEFQSGLFNALTGGYKGYTQHSERTHGADSLGMRFIINAPFPVRLLFGSVYLLVFPIPLWSGFQFESANQLFKSFQALFMYGLIPLLALTAWMLARRKELRTAPLLFMLFLFFGFTLSIAATSLETRHFGAFLVSILALAVLPDLADWDVKRAYKRLLAAFLSMMLLIHGIWIVLKVL